MILDTVIFPSSDVIQVRSWTEACTFIREDDGKLDLVLVDLFMPGKGSWKDGLADIVAAAKDTPVCVISSSSSQENVHAAFELGALGFLHKSVHPEKMKEALHKVLSGKVFLPRRLDMPATVGGSIPKYSLVTARQQEILFLLAEGKGNQQIADMLNLQESTVKRHVYNICKLFEVKNRGEAVHVARQMGLLVD